MRHQIKNLTFKDIPATWEEHYNKGFRYGTTIEFNSSEQTRGVVLKHAYDLLKAIPLGARSNTAYFFLRGMHNGLRHIGTDSIATIMTAHFPKDDEESSAISDEVEAILCKCFLGGGA